MRIFFELARRAFQRQIVYRAAVIAGLLTNLFFGVLRVAVMNALYGSRTSVAGISLQQAITFTGLSQALIGFLSLFSWYLLMNSVYTGEAATDLLKPVGYYSFWLAQDLGRSLVELVMRALPILLIYALLFNITVPGSLGQWLAFVLAVSLAWLLSFSWRFLINLVSFWTPNALGFGRFAFIITWFLSGFVMPMPYYPLWFQQICYLTPLPSLITTPIEVYLGLLTGPALIQALLVQVLWVLVLVGGGQVILRLGIRRLVILGG